MRGKNYGEQNGKNPTATQAAQVARKRRSVPQDANQADWGSVSSELLRRAIESVTRDGGAIRLGYTRDMGAYAVGFYEGGEVIPEYIPPSVDMDVWLQGVIDDYGK